MTGAASPTLALTGFTPPESDAPLDWALAYAKAGMPVFPVGASKKPLTYHGVKDATTDEVQIRAWWTSWPRADPAWAVPANVVVVDLDRKRGDDGFKDFVAHEGAHPDDVATPQASTPTGGRHLVYAANGSTYRNNVRPNGLGLDLRTHGGYIALPGPGNGRTWLRPLTTPLAHVPAWVAPAPAARARQQGAQRPFAGETPFARAALERACLAIEEAPNGAQEATLNKECFSIGGLIGAGELEIEVAVAALTAAAHRMPAYAEPWVGLEVKVRRAVDDGMRRPREHSAGGVSLDDFVAYMQNHDYVFMPAGDFWPAAESRRPAAAGQALRQERSPGRRRQDGRAQADPRQPMAREKRACRATDLVPRIAATGSAPTRERRRLDRPQECDRSQSIPTATRGRRRRGEGREMDSARPADLPCGGRPYRFLPRAPRAAAAGEDQPRPYSQRPPRHRQG